MGPILATTIGSVLSDYELVKRGFFSEGVGLALCLVVGFIGGLCAAPANGTTWPTDEMASRAVMSALYIGVAVALPSGAGAALSVTGNNTSSLVGVAISASLLPPAVNSGYVSGWIPLVKISPDPCVSDTTTHQPSLFVDLSVPYAH